MPPPPPDSSLEAAGTQSASDIGQDARPVFPPIVYVPCAPLEVDAEQFSVDLRQTRDGRLALLVYSALDRLIACCGEQQAWAVLATAELDQLQQRTDFQLIFLDVEIPDEFRRKQEVA